MLMRSRRFLWALASWQDLFRSCSAGGDLSDDGSLSFDGLPQLLKFSSSGRERWIYAVSVFKELV